MLFKIPGMKLHTRSTVRLDSYNSRGQINFYLFSIANHNSPFLEELKLKTLGQIDTQRA